MLSYTRQLVPIPGLGVTRTACAAHICPKQCNQTRNRRLMVKNSFAGVKEEMPLCKLAGHVLKCESKPSAEVDPKKITISAWYKAEFESSAAKVSEIKHKVEVRLTISLVFIIFSTL